MGRERGIAPGNAVFMVGERNVPESERRANNELRRKLTMDTVGDASRFAEYDLDGNQLLDFEEFLAMQPVKVRQTYSADEIKEWFNAADTDGNGSLSINEFFRWSLSNASMKHGATALETAFRKYDRDGGGYLDSFEFEKAATDMGFGAVAHDLFKALDHDGSGSVTYLELIESLTAEAPKDPETKKMLTALVWSFDKDTKDEARIDTSGWVIRGKTVASVREELQTLLRESGGHVADIVRLFDNDAQTALLIDDIEFVQTLRNKMGYKGPHHVLVEVFESIDTDKSGKIGFDELFEFVRGHRHSLDHRTKHVGSMRLQPPPGADFTLNEIAWDLETLRILMQQMLIRFHTGPADVIRAWDDSGDFQLDKREFVQNMRKFFDDQHADLWDSEVQPIVEQAFGAIQEVTIVGADGKRRDAGGNSHNERVRVSGIAKNRFAGDANQLRIDIIEFERWLDAPTQRPEHLKVVPKSRKLLRRQTTRRLELEKPKAPKRSPTKERMEQSLQQAAKTAAAREKAARRTLKEQTRRLKHMQRWEVPSALSPPPLRFGQPNVTSSPADLLLGRLTQPSIEPGIKLGPGGETRSPRSNLSVLAPPTSSSARMPTAPTSPRTLTVTTSPRARGTLSPVHSGASYPSPKSVGLSPKALTGWSPRLPRQTLGPHLWVHVPVRGY